MKVYMKITRHLDSRAVPVCILLNNAHIYYPKSADDFYEYLPVYTALAVEHLNLPNELGSIRKFLDYVQDGFDDLFAKCPLDDDREKQVYGEIDVKHGDLKFTTELSR